MGLGTSLFLIAVGAILDFAVDWKVQNVDLHAIGVILMIIGVIGLLLSLLFWNSWGGGAWTRRHVVVDDGLVDRPVRRRRVVRDDIIE